MIVQPNHPSYKSVAYAYVYLFLLFTSIIVMWSLMLVGGNPFSIRELYVYSEAGVKQKQFRAGSPVIIKGEFCSTSSMGVELYPYLEHDNGFRFTLPNGMMAIETGCFTASHGFIAPDIPPGKYTYRTAIKFQNNLVGRDESASTPPLTIEILK